MFDEPVSDLDIQIGAAKYSAINLHIINQGDRITEEEKLDYFPQLERIDQSPFCSTIIISNQNTPLTQIGDSQPVQVRTNEWIVDSEWIMSAAMKINQTIFESLEHLDMTKKQRVDLDDNPALKLKRK